MILKSQNIYLYYHKSYGLLKFNDSIVTSTEIILNDSDLNNLNNTLHKVTKICFVVKVHVRNGSLTLKSSNVQKLFKSHRSNSENELSLKCDYWIIGGFVRVIITIFC